MAVTETITTLIESVHWHRAASRGRSIVEKLYELNALLLPINRRILLTEDCDRKKQICLEL